MHRHHTDLAAVPLIELLADHQGGHSDLQMDAFITARAGGTLYGCYKQTLREIATRLNALRSHYHERAKLETKLQRQLSPVKRSLAELRRADVQLSVADSEREFSRFYSQAVAIREQMQEEGVLFPLSDEARHVLDCEMWEHRIKSKAAAEILSAGGINIATLELFLNCPKEMRGRLAVQFNPNNRSQLVDWFLNYECPMPEVRQLCDSEIIKCLRSSNSPKLLPSTSPTVA